MSMLYDASGGAADSCLSMLYDASGGAADSCLSMLCHASGGFTSAVSAFNVQEFPGVLFCTDNKPLDPLKNTCCLRVLCL